MNVKLRPFVRLIFLIIVLAIVPACSTTLTLPRTNNPGFGEPQNDYSWGMTWFNGKLYVGTSRNEMCVEGETVQFYNQYSDTAGGYSTSPAPGVTCPADLDALHQTLQAQIWQYDPAQANPSVPQSGWAKVYTAPAVPSPLNPNTTIGRDIAYRAASVVTINGTPTLLFSGITAGEFLRNTDGSPRVPAPRLLATTDGVNYTEFTYTGQIDLSGSAQQPSWQLQSPYPEIHYPMGFRTVVQVGSHILVVASDSLTGDGVIMELDPATSTFRQVSALRAFEIEVFNNQLYVGTANPDSGYAVFRSDLSTTDPATGYYTFSPVVTGGAGRGSYVASVISMHPFQGRLYVGSCGWYNLGGCELIRISPDGTWQLVVGASRQYQGTTYAPISGNIDGFMNFFNVHFWRIGDHDGALYVGTNDASWLFQGPSTDPLLKSEYGFDIFGSCDGTYWFKVTNNAFLDDSRNNFGARNFASSSSPDAAYVGSANHVNGTGIYQASNASYCGALSPSSVAPGASSSSPLGALLALRQGSAPTPPPSSSQPSVAGLTPPTRLEADVQSCATVLSWNPVPGATSYEVYRATYWQPSSTIARSNGPQLSSAAQALGLFQEIGRTQIPPGTWIPGELTKIGSTSQTTFIDRSAPAGGRYSYVVQAVDAHGATSAASNVAMVPSAAPPVNILSIATGLRDSLAGQKASLTSLSALNNLAQAQKALSKGDQAGALKALTALHTTVAQNPGQFLNPLTAQDLEIAISKLLRQVSLPGAGC